ncbi:MAG: Uma2 family endonuclease [Acidobacteriota bacterium]
MNAVNVRADAAATAEQKVLLTGEELLAMGDVGRCELVRGEIVRMSPTGERHGTVENNIAMALTQFVRQHRLG